MCKVNKFNRDGYCEDHGQDDLIFLEEELYDDAIIGVTTNGNVVYNGAMIIELLTMGNDGMSWEDASEHYDFNIVGSLVASDNNNKLPLLINLD